MGLAETRQAERARDTVGPGEGRTEKGIYIQGAKEGKRAAPESDKDRVKGTDRDSPCNVWYGVWQYS